MLVVLLGLVRVAWWRLLARRCVTETPEALAGWLRAVRWDEMTHIGLEPGDRRPEWHMLAVFPDVVVLNRRGRLIRLGGLLLRTGPARAAAARALAEAAERHGVPFRDGYA